METQQVTLEYAVRPSLVAKRLGKRLKPEGVQLVHAGEHSEWFFDPESGSVRVRILGTLDEGMREVEHFLNRSKLPSLYDGVPLLVALFPASPKDMVRVGFVPEPLGKVWEWKGMKGETSALNEDRS